MELDYPKGFPQNRQTQVEVEKILADRVFGLTQPSQALSFTELEDRALRWVCRVLGAFAHPCELGKKGQWTLTQIDRAVEEFRLELIRKAQYRMSNGRLNWVDRVFGTSIHADVRRRIELSVEWNQYQEELLALGEEHTRFLNTRADSDPTGNSGLTGLPVLPEPESADDLASRPQRVERFRKERSATFADIRYSSGVHKADFLHWKAGKLAASSVMSQRIEDVLSGKRPLKRNPGKNGIK
jgi:hypothetical protein